MAQVSMRKTNFDNSTKQLFSLNKNSLEMTEKLFTVMTPEKKMLLFIRILYANMGPSSVTL